MPTDDTLAYVEICRNKLLETIASETAASLESVDPAALAVTALHPRLRVPMNLVDHAFFVAEHDDYHLARITELLNEFGQA